MPLKTTLAQSHGAAVAGREISKLSAGTYALIVIGGIIFLIFAFVVLAKMRQDD